MDLKGIHLRGRWPIMTVQVFQQRPDDGPSQERFVEMESAWGGEISDTLARCVYSKL